MVPAIVLDLGNVVVRYDNRRITDGLARFSPYSSDDIRQRLFGGDLEQAFDSGMLSPGEFFSSLKELLSLSLGFDDFVPIWSEAFFDNPGMDELIDQLSGCSRLGMLSNTNTLHFDYIRRSFPVVRRFREYFLSFETGARKPDPAAFRNVIERYGRPPAEILYADDIPQYVEAARSQGITSFLFTTVEQFREDLERNGICL